MRDPYLAFLAEAETQGVSGCECGAKPLAQMGVSGPDLVTDLAAWPTDRSQGLTHGELQAYADFVARTVAPSYRTETYQQPVISDYGQSFVHQTRTAIATSSYGGARLLLQRWESLNLPTRSELGAAHARALESFHLPSNLTLREFDRKWRSRPGSWWGAKTGYNEIDLAEFRTKLHALGLEPMRRYLMALAIGRDLFAERFEDIGGVQPGLSDSVEETLLEGEAVRGAWENLAGRWVWKGVDAFDRPILRSAPLMPQPPVRPWQLPQLLAENRSLFRFLFRLPEMDTPTVRNLTPLLIDAHNRVAAVSTEGREISTDLPRSARLAGELFVALFDLLKQDGMRLIRALAGQSADMVRARALAVYPPPENPFASPAELAAEPEPVPLPMRPEDLDEEMPEGVSGWPEAWNECPDPNGWF